MKDNPQLSLFKGNKRRTEELAQLAGQAKSLLSQRLQEFGLSQAQAEEALRTYDTAHIEANLQIVERYLQAGKIRTTLAATTLDALKKDYRPKTAPREAALAAAKTSRKRERMAAAEQAATAEEDIATAARDLTTALAALNPAARQALEAEFSAAIEAGSLPGAKVLQEQYRTAGFDSIIVQSMFRGFARERLLVSGKEQEGIRAA